MHDLGDYLSTRKPTKSTKKTAKKHQTGVSKKTLKTVKTTTRKSSIPLKKTKKPLAARPQPKPSKTPKKPTEEEILREKFLEESRRSALLLDNRYFNQHMSEKVGTSGPEILRELVKSPKTDEDIASKLNTKVNDVRRALNLMNGYSIVKYDVSKDNKGWLIFKWRINNEKLDDYIKKMEAESNTVDIPLLPGNCNDFFICKKCYSTQKVVLPFDSAFESGFNCETCGKPYAILNKEETVALFKTVVAEQ